jgi:hypothetical protein
MQIIKEEISQYSEHFRVAPIQEIFLLCDPFESLILGKANKDK